MRQKTVNVDSEVAFIIIPSPFYTELFLCVYILFIYNLFLFIIFFQMRMFQMFRASWGDFQQPRATYLSFSLLAQKRKSLSILTHKNDNSVLFCFVFTNFCH